MTEWPTKALRAVAEVTLGRQRAPEYADGPNMVPYLRAANVNDGQLDLDNVMSMNFSPNEQRIFSLRRGDVLVTEGSGSLGTVGASAAWDGEIPETVCFQNTLLRLRPRPLVLDRRFLLWWARSAYAAGRFASIASGANIYHLSAERVRALPIRVPPIEDQRRIANFLDAETGRINSLISLRKQQRVLWMARRSALVSRGTAGLSESAEMRETKSQWYAQVSNAWRIVRVKHIAAKIGSGKTPSGGSNAYVSNGVPLLRSQNVHFDGLRMSDVVRISRDTHREMRGTAVRPMDVLLNITGASLGRCTYAPSDIGAANVNQHVCILRINPTVDARYVALACAGAAVQEQIDSMQVGGNREGLNFEQVGNLEIAIPRSRSDQIRVRERVTSEVSDVDQMVRLVDTQLTLLEERRNSLLLAAVTGQLDPTTSRGVDL